MPTYYHQRELKHEGLNKYRIIKAQTQYELEEKCRVIINQWNEQWKRKCEIEQHRSQVEWCLEQANELTTQAEEIQLKLTNILAKNVSTDLDATIKYFIRKDEYSIKMPPKPPRKTYPIEPKRSDEQYNPKVGFLSKLFGGEQRIILENDEKFHSDYHYWHTLSCEISIENDKTLVAYNKVCEKWEADRYSFENDKKKANDEAQNFWDNLTTGDEESINAYFSNIIGRVDIPIDYSCDSDLEYVPDSKILLVDFCLPTLTDIPNLKKVAYVKTQNAFKETFQTEAYMKKLYDQVIYQIVLSILNNTFAADYQFNYIDSVVINGRVNTIDKSTGQEISPYILSASINKAEFMQLNLNNIDAKAWFKANKGVSAVTFSSVTPVAPIMQMSKNDRRFVDGYDVVNAIDDSTNLAAMDWQDFENLIRDIFEKEFNQSGGEVKITQASRDGGVDAIAFDPDPIRGGKIVIQAKRYTNVVGVSAVRDLYGTVLNEGATKGILVTTANYGSDAYDFAKNKPLALMNGANLLALLEKHGHKAKIDINGAKEYFAKVDT